MRESPTFATSQYGRPSCSETTTPVRVVPAPRPSGAAMPDTSSCATWRRSRTSCADTTLSHDRGRRASIAMALATSPASWPPMPSATKNADGDAR